MQLLGGQQRAGGLAREVSLRPIDGELELLIAEARDRVEPFQAAVSLVLARAVAEVGGEPLTPEGAGALCVGDRQFLMQRLTCALGLGRQWLSVVCAGCHQRFDVDVDLAELPTCEAGAGFPWAAVTTSAGELRVRVPTGADQIAVSRGGGDADESAREMLARCLVTPAGGARPELSGEDVAEIELALDRVAPSVTNGLAGRCPECEREQEVRLDPYAILRQPPARLLDEVHTLALHYHWSERDILSLPRARRLSYLSRVDRARGLAS